MKDDHDHSCAQNIGGIFGNRNHGFIDLIAIGINLRRMKPVAAIVLGICQGNRALQQRKQKRGVIGVSLSRFPKSAISAVERLLCSRVLYDLCDILIVSLGAKSEQGVRAHVENPGQRHDLCDIRHRRIILPSTDRLRGNGKKRAKLLLCHIALTAQPFQRRSQAHNYTCLSMIRRCRP